MKITQVVPPDWCAKCDVCCRFPEKNSFLAPYFTREEIVSSIKDGIDASYFTETSGCKINLTPYKEGYICPAFDPAKSHCMIYDVRPLDCMIYPFAIMRDVTGKEIDDGGKEIDRRDILVPIVLGPIVLGIDIKCPYIREYRYAYSIKVASGEIASAIESPPLLSIFAENQGLIGPYQDDVIPVAALKGLKNVIIS